MGVTAKSRIPIRVIYLIGSGRSGSTLLANRLGSHHDIINAGEVYNFRNLFESAEEFSRFCSCGKPLLECEYWASVRAELYVKSGRDLVDLKNCDPRIFGINNYNLLAAIRATSGRSVILDSSKRHYRLRLLLGSPLFEVSVVHLVRDGRAQAYSSLVTAIEQGQSAIAYYKKLHDWQKKNLAVDLIYRRTPRFVRIRYEDFVSDPLRILEQICNITHLDFEISLNEAPKESFEHEFSGNRRVIGKPREAIRLDTRYLEELTGLQWVTGSAVASAALIRFGYSLARRRARG